MIIHRVSTRVHQHNQDNNNSNYSNQREIMEFEEKLIGIRISGDGIHPGSIRSKELSELLIALEDMIAAIIVKNHPKIKKESIIIGLSEINRGSLALQFAPNFSSHSFDATYQIAKAINDNDYRSLPSKSITSLEVIDRFNKKYKSETEFSTINGAVRIVAKMTPETIIKKEKPIIGKTTLYGEVTRVGGAEPKVQFRTIDGVLLHCETTKEIARKAGSKLYMQVGFEGEATWNPKSLIIDSFKITTIVPIEITSLSKAFQELKSVIGEEFDQIDDVEKFVNDIRYGNRDKE